MLRKLTELSPEDGARLMAIYRESNGENAAWFAPDAPTPEEGLRRTEAGFLTWLREDFLSKKELSDQQQDWLDQYAILNYCGMVDLFDQARPMFCMDEN